MPNIKEMKNIFKRTPTDQAIMLEGIHGIGKSEIIKQIFLEDGYRVVTLFLGQMADAGDLIGLPDRTEIEIKRKNPDNQQIETIIQKITEFCPPKWWPFDADDKVVIFLDEFNRGKPEVYQCIFDMVLNRKLQGFTLPEHTRIIAAQNPNDDMYDVQDLDPALLDRFNVYKFYPDVEEWIDWAVSKKLNNYVIGFINKNRAYLDPCDGPGASVNSNTKQKNISDKINEILPSRRSWKKVSDILIQYPDLLQEQDFTLLRTMLLGIVGTGATSKFSTYLKEVANQINGGTIIINWASKIKDQVKLMSNQELVHLNKEMSIYLDQNESVLFDKDTPEGKREVQKYALNVQYYLESIPIEIAAEFMDHVTTAYNANKKWPNELLDMNPKLIDWFISVLRGDNEHEKNVKNLIKEDSEIDPLDHFGNIDNPDDIINM
jgi:hypothetical protein